MTEDDDLNNVRYKAKYRYKTKQPLTDEEIRWLVGGDDEAQEWNRKVVKAVELAHGIGVKDEPDSSVT